ncbi:MAG: type II toxin-antitoxin system YafQ family toxin [Spirochaetales bacterium]|nr:type II toxin-antitoxin system YafQ family toxin [Spirochaetales bacterium]
MYSIKTSTQFRKDIKRIQKSGRKKSDMTKIKWIIEQLTLPAALPEQNREHTLSGNYNIYRECHILPDLLLIYLQDKEANELFLYRIGSHSELFE